MGIISDIWNGDVWILDDVIRDNPTLKTLSAQKSESLDRLYISLNDEQKKLLMSLEAVREEYNSKLCEAVFKKGVGLGSRMMTEIYETNIKLSPDDSEKSQI